ncbi:MAG TPA: hypothetical protein PK331_01380 [Gordonia sp. (in: high G+C Gram-positive bacteria)]|uniref:hypothetical protein n=1 Tax=unclassified Gordonia (in: high G+C Gram-positive bacteria) TaxID=2657482 RepID=UPI000FB32E1A|nr:MULTISPECIES: hypothetical protein [unclassified Gordonia (in: high G+C Gram-positive bacteria)]RUP39491.1 MAG: hypothetical protein EKK60_06775 [Gordonia sp. (in: high G+C Gram-positive bacteria)]HNP55977.1 hypothetical protein [Gordonia sp. (in: high G+C Gram-positive bacteria)]HRC49562.1 hypothetical protein [Gordonia sp. (in: high G+C Gram-positive bacteria)]
MSQYEKVRFIGYAVPTTPADIVAVGDPNGTGNVAGTYRAHDDIHADIATRGAALKNAVDTARAALPDEETGVLNVFLAPEFYWHGPLGPYVHAPGEPDPGDLILEHLGKLFPTDEYPGFLLVLGTAISAEVADLGSLMSAPEVAVRNTIVRALGEGWRESDGPLALVIFDSLINFIKNCHAYPAVEVRNRAFVLGPGDLDGIDTEFGVRELTTEKYFDSNEDLLLWDVTGKAVITEQMAAYPILDTSGGDFKKKPDDPHALFRMRDEGGSAGPVVGVEICLDHSDHRMRKAVARSPWPQRHDGLDLHLVPSCGMQLHPQSVAAHAGGWAFNCDGQYALGSADQSGSPQTGTVGSVPCAYADYVGAADPGYGAHTQLAWIATGPRGANPPLSGSADAEFHPALDVDVVVLPVTPGSGFDECFAGGPGAVHIYGAAKPLPLRNPASTVV